MSKELEAHLDAILAQARWTPTAGTERFGLPA